MVYSFGLVYLNIFYKFCANLRYAIALEIEATCLAPHRVVAADGALPPELLLFQSSSPHMCYRRCHDGAEGISGMVENMEKMSLTCGPLYHWMIYQNHLPHIGSKSGWFRLESILSGFESSMVQFVWFCSLRTKIG